MKKTKEPAVAYKPALRARRHEKPRETGKQAKARWAAFLRQGWKGWQGQGSGSLDVVRLVREGVPLEAIEAALEEGVITREELHEIVIPPRTLSHRKEKGQPLTPDESDKLMRLLRIKAMAFDTFQNGKKANGWLNKPNRILSGEVPIQLTKTESGARLVEDELHRINWGLFIV